MHKLVVLVHMPDGETVAVGPFHKADKADEFWRDIEAGNLATPLRTVRMETGAALLRELKAKTKATM